MTAPATKAPRPARGERFCNHVGCTFSCVDQGVMMAHVALAHSGKAQVTYGDTLNELIADLRKDVDALIERVDELEREE